MINSTPFITERLGEQKNAGMNRVNGGDVFFPYNRIVQLFKFHVSNQSFVACQNEDLHAKRLLKAVLVQIFRPSPAVIFVYYQRAAEMQKSIAKKIFL